VLLAPAAAAVAGDDGEGARELAERYAPVLAFVEQAGACDTGGEPYRPVPVEVVLDRPDVQLRSAAGAVLVAAPGAADLAGAPADAHLDLPGRALRPGCTYEQWFREAAAGVPTTAYARVLTDPEQGRVVLQYWLYYVFNDWNNRHEADWEMLQLVFESASVEEALRGTPTEVGYSQHEGAERARWGDRKLELRGDSPVVRPGVGSHANFFTQDLFLGHSAQEGFGCDDTRGVVREDRAEVVLLPATVPSDPSDAFAWLAYEGHWGERNRGPNNGPTGPVTKDSWIDPLEWMDAEWRDGSTVVPAARTVAPTATGFFCWAVESGSDVYIAVLDAPLVVLGVLAALVLFAVWLSRRTVWSPAPAFPIDEERRTGQILKAAAAIYRRLWRLLFGIGIFLVPVAVLATLVQQLVFRLSPVGTLVAVADEDELFGLVVALLVGSLGIVVGMAVVQAGIAAALVAVDRGEHPDALDAYRMVVPRLARLVGAMLLVIIAVVGLSLTVVGLPVAAFLALRWSLVPQVVAVEGLAPTAALGRSWRLTRRKLAQVGVLAAAANIGISALGPLLACILMLVLDLPLGLLNLVAGLLAAGMVPYAGTVLALNFLDLRREDEREEETAPEPVVV
jgi:hypothetical protein